MKCPYCGGTDHTEMKEHPYPYLRKDKAGAILQSIAKLMCSCGNYFFFEKRSGHDMGAPKGLYGQVYKQGHYQFKDLSNPVA